MLLQQTSSTRAVFARHVWCLQVFSQWKDALLVVSKALSAHSIGHVSLTGGRQGKVPSLEPSTSSMECIWQGTVAVWDTVPSWLGSALHRIIFTKCSTACLYAH